MADESKQQTEKRPSRTLIWIIGLTFLLSVLIVGGVAFYALVVAPRAAGQAVDAELPRVSYRQILEATSDRVALSRLADNERILVLDFPNLAAQGRALNRIAALIEKREAPRDRVLSDATLEAFIVSRGNSPATFFFGHDYRAGDLARFFALAEAGGVGLNDDELWLRDLLLAQGFFVRHGEGYKAMAPEQTLVSVPQPQPDDEETVEDESVDVGLRDTILRHELSHGEFFTNQAYRDYCRRFWQHELSRRERRLFRDFLNAADYDAGNDEIAANETQAYLMHTPDERMFSARHLGISDRDLLDLRRRFLAGEPPTTLFDADHPVHRAVKP